MLAINWQDCARNSLLCIVPKQVIVPIRSVRVIEDTQRSCANSCSPNRLGTHRYARFNPLGRRGSTVATVRGSAAHTTTHGVLVGNTTSLVDSRGGRNVRVSGRVDSDGDPGHDAVGDVVGKLDPLDEGVHISRLLAQDRVLGVQSEVLGVGVVRGGRFDEGDQVLVEEDLADVGGRGGAVAAEEGTVGTDGGLVDVVREDVNVGGTCMFVLVDRWNEAAVLEGLTAGVVTRDDRLVLCHAVHVGLDNTAQEGVVEVSEVVTVTVARSGDTTVNSGCLKDVSLGSVVCTCVVHSRCSARCPCRQPGQARKS